MATKNPPDETTALRPLPRDTKDALLIVGHVNGAGSGGIRIGNQQVIIDDRYRPPVFCEGSRKVDAGLIQSAQIDRRRIVRRGNVQRDCSLLRVSLTVIDLVNEGVRKTLAAVMFVGKGAVRLQIERRSKAGA